jgi:hypothetical protein
VTIAIEKAPKWKAGQTLSAPTWRGCQLLQFIGFLADGGGEFWRVMDVGSSDEGFRDLLYSTNYEVAET